MIQSQLGSLGEVMAEVGKGVFGSYLKEPLESQLMEDVHGYLQGSWLTCVADVPGPDMCAALALTLERSMVKRLIANAIGLNSDNDRLELMIARNLLAEICNQYLGRLRSELSSLGVHLDMDGELALTSYVDCEVDLNQDHHFQAVILGDSNHYALIELSLSPYPEIA